MQFNNELHQKVRLIADGQLYVFVYAEFPDFVVADNNYEVVIHPISQNGWITHNTQPAVRQLFTHPKSALQPVGHLATE